MLGLADSPGGCSVLRGCKVGNFWPADEKDGRGRGSG